jgi:hypothetical protein
MVSGTISSAMPSPTRARMLYFLGVSPTPGYFLTNFWIRCPSRTSPT